jgi:hypothetical protein
MGVITLDLPVVGQPNTTEDVKVRNNFQTLQNTINGNIDASNLSPVVLSQLGNFKQALSAIQVQDVGNNGQIRAGRVLTPADFTNMGLSTPLGLWNLGTVNDASGNVRNLTNKGTVTFDTGITGSAAEAAVFTGSTGQALYIADTGAADPFRLSSTGFYGDAGSVQLSVVSINLFLLRCSPVVREQIFDYYLTISSTNALTSAFRGSIATGITDVLQMIVGTLEYYTADGTKVKLYVDGSIRSKCAQAAYTANTGCIAHLNIGGFGADATVLLQTQLSVE